MRPSRESDPSNPIGHCPFATSGAIGYIKSAVWWNVQAYLSSELSKMDRLSASKLVSALLLLAAHFGAVSAQSGSSGAAGTGPADAAGYLLGVAAAVVAVAAFVWN